MSSRINGRVFEYKGENRCHDSIWELIRVILFRRVILHCRMWPIVFSLQTTTFVL